MMELTRPSDFRNQDISGLDETQFKNFADSIPHLAWIANAHGEIVWRNKRWHNYTGLPVELPLNNFSVVHPSHLAQARQILNTAIQKVEPFEFEILLKGADGNYRWFLSQGTPVFNSRGQLTKWFGTNTNIDDQKRSANFNDKLQKFTSALSQSNSLAEVAYFVAEQSRALFGATKIMVADVDYEDNRLVLNSFSGFGEDLLKSLMPYLSLNEQFPMQECAKTGKSIFCSSIEELASRWPTAEAVARHGTSKAFCFLPLKYDGKVRTVIASGYSDEKEFQQDEKDFLEAAAQQSSNALERARIYDALQNAIRSRDSFMGIASHELKTPLTSLKLQAQMLSKNFIKTPDAVNSEKMKKFVGIVNEQVGRLSTLVDDMLDISRIEAGKLAIHKEAKDICSVVKDVTERFAAQFEIIGSSIGLRLCEPTCILVDVFRIEQVINNLLTNAIKYAPGKPIDISVEKDSEAVRIIIRDQGPGIPKDDHLKIFQRFERLVSANEVSGLGIGLFIAKQIVEAHDGKIWVESDPGTGSSFFVQFPLLPL